MEEALTSISYARHVFPCCPTMIHTPQLALVLQSWRCQAAPVRKGGLVRMASTTHLIKTKRKAWSPAKVGLTGLAAHFLGARSKDVSVILQ